MTIIVTSLPCQQSTLLGVNWRSLLPLSEKALPAERKIQLYQINVAASTQGSLAIMPKTPEFGNIVDFR